MSTLLGPSIPGDAPAEVPVHLTALDDTRRANAIIGVRFVLNGLRPFQSEPITALEAGRTVERFLAGERPLLLGNARNAIQARVAAENGVARSDKAISVAVGLSEAEVEAMAAEAAREPEKPKQGFTTAPGDEFEDWDPSVKLALNLLAQHGGNFVVAEAWAKIMLGSDPDGRWDDVLEIIRTSFPPPLTSRDD